MRKGQGAFEYMMLLAGVLFLATVAFFLFRGGVATTGGKIGFSQCKAQLTVVSACYYANGTWQPGSATALKANDYGVSLDCTKTGGGLDGTPWDVPTSEDEFTCGNGPPQ